MFDKGISHVNEFITKNRISPFCLSIRDQLKNSDHVCSDTEVGVLIANSCHCPIPPKGGMFHHRSGVTQPKPLLCPLRSENPLICPETSHPRTRGASRWG
ncbi:hypothetical protein AVEN_74336-1 [Araneus ventricosus]|uniref:Uncharacterized protein n=1 Tax=Araneus ventricosus TaxID=182803 RepID=A0A4Y2PGU1_ARAVE|nr:hypothetical protein AVEN_74336-1 [Araneus ventricosus]